MFYLKCTQLIKKSIASSLRQIQSREWNHQRVVLRNLHCRLSSRPCQSWECLKFGIFALGSGLGAYCIRVTFDYAPITGRLRFICVDRNLATSVLEKRIRPVIGGRVATSADHDQVKRVEKVLRTLKEKNKDKIKNLNVQMKCYDFDEVQCIVLPDGSVYISLAMLGTFKNDNELAFVLAHELGHAILNHGSEEVSYEILLVIMSFLRRCCPFVRGWWDSDRYDNFADDVTFARKLKQMEFEADKLAFELMRETPFDLYDAVDYMKRMEVMSCDYDIANPVSYTSEELLSSHPSLERRWVRFESFIMSEYGFCGI